MSQVGWPEILVTGKIPEEYKTWPEDKMKQALCADGLSGWSICMSGMADEIPGKFGHGMRAISEILGVAGPDSLLEWSNKNPIT